MLFYLVATCFFIKEIIKKEYLNEKKKKYLIFGVL